MASKITGNSTISSKGPTATKDRRSTNPSMWRNQNFRWFRRTVSAMNGFIVFIARPKSQQATHQLGIGNRPQFDKRYLVTMSNKILTNYSPRYNPVTGLPTMLSAYVKCQGHMYKNLTIHVVFCCVDKTSHFEGMFIYIRFDLETSLSNSVKVTVNIKCHGHQPYHPNTSYGVKFTEIGSAILRVRLFSGCAYYFQGVLRKSKVNVTNVTNHDRLWNIIPAIHDVFRFIRTIHSKKCPIKNWNFELTIQKSNQVVYGCHWNK